MLSRVADSLYWMSRYFERADHFSRVLEANYILLLNPSKPSREARWKRITEALGLQPESMSGDSQTTIMRLIAQPGNRSSIVSSITGARENASQVREQISSEMWESLNQLYHKVTAASSSGTDFDPFRLLTSFREGAYHFYGVSDSTMNHGEGWYFIQLGRFMERACGLSLLVDAHFAEATGADDLDWVGLLTSCAAVEAYRKVNTSNVNPECVADFLILNPEFPHTIRYSADQMSFALDRIAEITTSRKSARTDRLIGKLRASLTYAGIDEIMARNLHNYLNGVLEQCHNLHAAMHQIFIDYPIESAIEA
ncbi:MAG: alpha-E domain-containing protein [Bryobacteraceae bacterium]